MRMLMKTKDLLPADQAQTLRQPANAARRGMLGALAAVPLVLATTGCAITRGGSDKKTPEQHRRDIDSNADATLSRLYEQVRGSRELTAKARGLLIFPSILAAGLVVGGEYGEGVLRTGGRSQAYYRAASGSFGFQAGAQSKAVVIGIVEAGRRNGNGEFIDAAMGEQVGAHMDFFLGRAAVDHDRRD